MTSNAWRTSASATRAPAIINGTESGRSPSCTCTLSTQSASTSGRKGTTQVAHDPTAVDQVAGDVSAGFDQVRIGAVGQGHREQATQQEPQRQTAFSGHAADGQDHEQDDHHVAEGITQCDEPARRGQIGALPERPKDEGPAQKEERGRHEEAVEDHARLADPRASQGGVSQQGGHGKRDAGEVADVGPRRNRHLSRSRPACLLPARRQSTVAARAASTVPRSSTYSTKSSPPIPQARHAQNAAVANAATATTPATRRCSSRSPISAGIGSRRVA